MLVTGLPGSGKSALLTELLGDGRNGTMRAADAWRAWSIQYIQGFFMVRSVRVRRRKPLNSQLRLRVVLKA